MSQSAFAHDLSLHPFWWDDAAPARLPDIELPKQVDAVVVGSGYAGLSAAITFAAAGLETLVMEAGELGEGASTRNGGSVGETLRIGFTSMEAKWGRERAIAFYVGVREAKQYLEHLIATYGIACHYRRVGRFTGAHKPQDYDAMAREVDARRKALKLDAEMVPAKEVRRVVDTQAFHGGRLIHSDGNLHPALLHQGLVREAMKAGVRFAVRTRAERTIVESRGHVVVSNRGNVRTRHVIVATNGYTDRFAPWLARRVIPIRSQIIATEPLAAATVERLIPTNRQIGDTRRLHNYFRRSPDGSRILFGGRAGVTTTTDRLKSASILRRQMLDFFPELSKIGRAHV